MCIIPEVVHIGHALLQDGLFPPEFSDLQLEDPDVLQALVILDLAFVEHRLLDLDLLVQQGQLVVAPHQLCA